MMRLSARLRREVPESVDRFLIARAVTTRVVTERKMPWEFLPDAMLREPSVWETLIDTVGMTVHRLA
ncbi:hypothetical protein [Nonomuraea sp. NEAU-A123]|uniref:hypothetical protein n=1 Tax=Nonomuraea sp. NEAU-A123 TaxID=2839649 RepID=UPI001BE4981C|nr:hypothetical protein [Nonomuraea sp. NEAU-A123]MBT2234967.1 hypothetical protein [Nonomuraea sp. NEAU-A123]